MAKRIESDERRDRMIGVKVTEEEYERVRVLAFEARKSMGGYVRDLLSEQKAPKVRR